MRKSVSMASEHQKSLNGLHCEGRTHEVSEDDVGVVLDPLQPVERLVEDAVGDGTSRCCCCELSKE